MTTQPVADVPGQDADGLIATADALRAYLDSHPDRHAPDDNGRCACGWPHIPTELLGAFAGNTSFPTQAQHADAILIGALGDLLPSDTSALDNGVMTPVPWRSLVHDLYAEINHRDGTVDPRLITLMKWCLDEGHADVATLAQVTVMHAGFLANLLEGPAPRPQPEARPETEPVTGAPPAPADDR
ncbi:hypothetical protein ACFV42_48155 [Streptomyces solisilvae]|uniref:hypothetical protein n=1 Tax=Streptomyces malaysiensis TaxID=92644 RepID=UPI0036C7D4FF